MNINEKDQIEKWRFDIDDFEVDLDEECVMGAYRELETNPPCWAEQIYREFCKFRAKYEAEQKLKSLTVGTDEAGVLLGKSARPIRQWYKLGKMPKNTNKADENLAWNRSDI